MVKIQRKLSKRNLHGARASAELKPDECLEKDGSDSFIFVYQRNTGVKEHGHKLEEDPGARVHPVEEIILNIDAILKQLDKVLLQAGDGKQKPKA